MTKAALNMLAVKQKAERPDLTVITLCPGPVKTGIPSNDALPRQIADARRCLDMNKENGQLEPEESVAGILKVITSVSKEDSGKFLSHEGKRSPLNFFEQIPAGKARGRRLLLCLLEQLKTIENAASPLFFPEYRNLKSFASQRESYPVPRIFLCVSGSSLKNPDRIGDSDLLAAYSSPSLVSKPIVTSRSVGIYDSAHCRSTKSTVCAPNASGHLTLYGYGEPHKYQSLDGRKAKLRSKRKHPCPTMPSAARPTTWLVTGSSRGIGAPHPRKGSRPAWLEGHR
ncbi:hypothetical protein NUW54_g13254 [Trametes sanguinea]|uniref:Uncharacterized protein n=1 Tax=Trametes sanguinea TaxID=158606 RepID=A0ACC1MMY9_9APHY|nr:hypothetical protein NUW54_g13254 [Trametes sanguinea]